MERLRQIWQRFKESQPSVSKMRLASGQPKYNIGKKQCSTMVESDTDESSTNSIWRPNAVHSESSASSVTINETTKVRLTLSIRLMCPFFFSLSISIAGRK